MNNSINKHHIFLSLLVAIVWMAVGISSCDSIDQQDRLQYVKPEVSGRCILVEDYTGQACVNCPTATDIIEEMQRAYGADTIIAVAIHSGGLGVKPSEKHPDGLATDLGDKYYNYWNIQYQPMGVIDRSDGPLDKDIWTAKVAWDLQQPQVSKVNIDVETSFDADSRTLNIDVDVIGTEGETEGKLQLWLTEDNIIAFQDMPQEKGGGTKHDYVHNHVLRDAVNGDWGEDLRVGEGNVKHFSHTYRVNSTWKEQDLAVVAFVYNGEGVVQATRKKIRN